MKFSYVMWIVMVAACGGSVDPKSDPLSDAASEQAEAADQPELDAGQDRAEDGGCCEPTHPVPNCWFCPQDAAVESEAQPDGSDELPVDGGCCEPTHPVPGCWMCPQDASDLDGGK